MSSTDGLLSCILRSRRVRATFSAKRVRWRSSKSARYSSCSLIPRFTRPSQRWRTDSKERVMKTSVSSGSSSTGRPSRENCLTESGTRSSSTRSNPTDSPCYSTTLGHLRTLGPRRRSPPAHRSWFFLSSISEKRPPGMYNINLPSPYHGCTKKVLPARFLLYIQGPVVIICSTARASSRVPEHQVRRLSRFRRSVASRNRQRNRARMFGERGIGPHAETAPHSGDVKAEGPSDPWSG